MMKLRTLALPVLLISSIWLLVACGGDDDKTPANCAAICAQQNNLCKSTTDCDALCSTLSQVVKKTGCESEYQAGLNCLSEKNVCDEEETACPVDSLYTCIGKFCAEPANAADPICAE